MSVGLLNRRKYCVEICRYPYRCMAHQTAQCRQIKPVQQTLAGKGMADAVRVEPPFHACPLSSAFEYAVQATQRQWHSRRIVSQCAKNSGCLRRTHFQPATGYFSGGKGEGNGACTVTFFKQCGVKVVQVKSIRRQAQKSTSTAACVNQKKQDCQIAGRDRSGLLQKVVEHPFQVVQSNCFGRLLLFSGSADFAHGVGGGWNFIRSE